jgi:glycosyltransferase involved in cell wall biosynthesis
MNKVRMFGPLGESSGYGNAVRNFATAFSNSNIPTKFQFGRKAEDSNSEFMATLNRYTGDTNIDFYLHGPSWSRHNSLAYKIGYFYWEADCLPISWEKMINQVNELWVPCNLVADACRKARFRGPIKVVPTPVNGWDHDNKISIPSDFSKNYIVSDDVFKFYSIFQWHERKGYRELLTAYYKTFHEEDNVLLIIKANQLEVGGYTKDKIKSDILNIKKRLNQTYYPRLYLCKDIIPTEHIQALHNIGDCYVSPHHGEGWGVPIHDAMMSGNHIITTRFGGVTEHLDDSSAHLIDYKIGPVSGMEWSPLYGGHQNWAHPSVRSLSNQMKKVYSNPNEFTFKTENAHRIANKMNIDAVSEIINKELSVRRGK